MPTCGALPATSRRVSPGCSEWVAPPPTPGLPGSRPPASGELQLLDRNGRPIPIPPRAPPQAATPNAPAPGVAQALIDAFNQRGQSSAPAGQIVFVRALATASGRRLVLGALPRDFAPMSLRPGGRTVLSRGGKLWRLMVVQAPIGVMVEVGALAQSISARAARLRTIVIWTGVVGLLLVLPAP